MIVYGVDVLILLACADACAHVEHIRKRIRQQAAVAADRMRVPNFGIRFLQSSAREQWELADKVAFWHRM